MNILTKALDECKFTIPSEILNIVFMSEDNNFTNELISLDERILAKVIRPRVLIDMNLVGGEHIKIDLDGVPRIEIDRFSSIFSVPQGRIMNKTIMTVMSIGFIKNGPYGGGSYSTNNIFRTGGSSLTSAGAKIADASTNIPNVSTATAELVGHNKIIIYDRLGVRGVYEVTCVVGNEENLNNIAYRSIPAFSKLVGFAVKSFIYNTMLIKLDKGYLYGGQDLSSIKEIIDSYSEAEENYNVFLNETWRKIASMNQADRIKNFIKLQLPVAL